MTRGCGYVADGERRIIKDDEFGENDWNMPKAAERGNVTPLFMPRWASRLTLTVTDVRVERLKDITNEDCIAEGVPVHPNANAPRVGLTQDAFAREHGLISHYGAAYRRIWEEINGKGSWDANPWVIAYTFIVHGGNIDQIAKEAA
jgi:hypothetical protein